MNSYASSSASSGIYFGRDSDETPSWVKPFIAGVIVGVVAMFLIRKR
ncbi:MAG TPA: hypothetical protein VGF13_00220 [Verrucomicrobiae bacterium]|jgi:hypothetical protein